MSEKLPVHAGGSQVAASTDTGKVSRVPAGGSLPPSLGAIDAAQTNSFGRLRRSMRGAVLVTLVFTTAIGAFLTKTVIAGAVVGSGVIVVETGPKNVQHQSGGVVRELLVREGDVVEAGQSVLILDQVVADAQLRAATSSLVQKQARLDRLIAERDGLEELRFDGVTGEMRALEANTAHFLDVERRQFELRRESREGQREQLFERISQTEEQVRGEEAQLSATTEEMEFVQNELQGLRNLFQRKLVTYERLSDMERSLTQLRGRQASLASSIASNRGRVSEIKLQILQIDQSLRAELTDQIAQTQQEVSEYAERRVIAQEAKDRSVIVAPQSGTVHELAVHTVGGVVQPAEVLMRIVPGNDALVGEVHIRPTDIDQVFPGQAAEIHFSAFDRGTTPVINGTLSRVSPDLEHDQRTGAAFYNARIHVEQDEMARLGALQVVPGMPLEVFIKTNERTIISYLSKPLTDQMNRAFR